MTVKTFKMIQKSQTNVLLNFLISKES